MFSNSKINSSKIMVNNNISNSKDKMDYNKLSNNLDISKQLVMNSKENKKF